MMAGQFTVFLLITLGSLNVAEKVCGPDTSDELNRLAVNAYKNASLWLQSQQNDQWGWDDTSTIVLVLQLTNDNWFNRENLESQLNVKQLEIEMLSHLRMCMYNSTSGAEQSTDLPAGNLAYYVLALYSTCHDVSDFYGHDLLQLLKQKMHNFPVESFSNPFQYSLALLALCNAESYIDSSFVNMFKGLQDDDGSYFYGDVDTTAMAAMALTCMSHMPQFVNDATINATLDGCVDYLRSRQEPSGNYANIFASALSDQAFTAAGIPSSEWQCENLIRSILAEQDDDGSFNGHLMTTMQVLPSLVGKHYSEINTEMCNITSNKDKQDIIQLFWENVGGDLISVSITVIDTINYDQVLGKFNVYVSPGNNLYSIMIALEASTDGEFNFIAEDSAWGHYITSMYGIQSSTVDETYWAIYNYTQPLAVGVDDYYPNNDDNIIFKFTSYAAVDATDDTVESGSQQKNLQSLVLVILFSLGELFFRWYNF